LGEDSVLAQRELRIIVKAHLAGLIFLSFLGHYLARLFLPLVENVEKRIKSSVSAV
jgi:hypothetical protein